MHPSSLRYIKAFPKLRCFLSFNLIGEGELQLTEKIGYILLESCSYMDSCVATPPHPFASFAFPARHLPTRCGTSMLSRDAAPHCSSRVRITRAC